MLWKKRVKEFEPKSGKLNRVCGILLLGIVCTLIGYAGMQINAAKEVSSVIRQFVIASKEDALYLVSTQDTAVYEPETVSGNEAEVEDEAAVIADEVSAVFQQVNLARAEIGLTELVWDDELAQAADIRAKEIEQTFSHVRPDGSDWWTVNDEILYGENLARGYQNADSVMAAWMESSEHKDNILYAAFETIGIAFYENDGQWYWVQEFGY